MHLYTMIGTFCDVYAFPKLQTGIVDVSSQYGCAIFIMSRCRPIDEFYSCSEL
jgi:hypothetical protein